MSLDQAKRDEIKVCLLSGMSVAKTARQCGVSFYIADAERRRHKFPKTRERSKKCSTSTINQMRKLVSQGNPLAQVAAACGVNKRTAIKYQLQRPIPARFPGRLGDIKKQQIIKLLLKGVPAVTAARISKTSRLTVRFLKFETDIHLLDEKMKYDTHTVENIMEQLLAGELPKNIAKDCGVASCFVTMVKRKFGLESNHETRHKIEPGLKIKSSHKIKSIQFVHEQKRQEIERLLLSGMSTDKVAAACGRATSTVHKIKSTMQQFKRPIVTAPKLNEINQLLDEGVDPSIVAARCGRSIVTVMRVIKARIIQEQQMVTKKEQIDPVPLCVENAPGSASACSPFKRIEFLDEIPFCILI
ncbi:hypothetical protein BC940DRAFT_307082 [Gongronella butleri]|nr:hypothetical protein BC940DRAFT_307082 [Gongronella butleri]